MMSPERVWVVRTTLWEGMPEDCWEKGCAAIGESTLEDLREYETREALAKAWRRANRWASKSLVSNWVGQMWTFSRSILRGHWVVTPDSEGMLMVGVATGGYRHTQRPLGPDAAHIIPVRWIARVERRRLHYNVRYSLRSHLTVFELPRFGSLVRAVLGECPAPRKQVSAVKRLISESVRGDWTRTEAATIAKLVLPVLEKLGWNKIYEIEQEYRVKGRAVDVALLCEGRPLAFIEAKALGALLKPQSSRVEQAVGYAADAHVEWAILTDGVRWWVYDPCTKAQNQGEPVLAVDLLQESEDADPPEAILLLTRYAMLGGALHTHARSVAWFNAVRTALASPSHELLRAFTAQARLATDNETLKWILQHFSETCPRPPALVED